MVDFVRKQIAVVKTETKIYQATNEAYYPLLVFRPQHSKFSKCPVLYAGKNILYFNSYAYFLTQWSLDAMAPQSYFFEFVTLPSIHAVSTCLFSSCTWGRAEKKQLGCKDSLNSIFVCRQGQCVSSFSEIRSADISKKYCCSLCSTIGL